MSGLWYANYLQSRAYAEVSLPGWTGLDYGLYRSELINYDPLVGFYYDRFVVGWTGGRMMLVGSACSLAVALVSAGRQGIGG